MHVEVTTTSSTIESAPEDTVVSVISCQSVGVGPANLTMAVDARWQTLDCATRNFVH